MTNEPQQTLSASTAIERYVPVSEDLGLPAAGPLVAQPYDPRVLGQPPRGEIVYAHPAPTTFGGQALPDAYYAGRIPGSHEYVPERPVELPRPIRRTEFGREAPRARQASPDAGKQPARPEKRGPVTIDESRVFYVTQGPDAGGIRHNWKRWRYITEGDSITAVEVIYAEERTKDGQTLTDSVTLVGADAWNFLRLVDDRNQSAFRRTGAMQA